MFYSKTQNDLIQFYCWWSENKTIEYISKNLIFFILFIRTSDFLFDMKKLMTIKNSLEWNENRLFLYGPFRSFLHPIFYVM